MIQKAGLMDETLTSESTPQDWMPSAEDSARAVARMRAAVGDRDLLARYTQAALRENGFSYRDQESHTGLAASTVYNMALGKEAGPRAVQQFAAFAAYRAGREETRNFWKDLLLRLRTVDAAPGARLEFSQGQTSANGGATAEEVALLYARLHHSGNRRAVLDLLNALCAAEAGSGPSLSSRGV